MDATGLRALEDVYDKARRDGTLLILAGVNPQPREVLEQSGFVARIGAENVTVTLDQALERARAALTPAAVR